MGYAQLLVFIEDENQTLLVSNLANSNSVTYEQEKTYPPIHYSFITFLPFCL